MYIKRHLVNKIHEQSSKFPVISITGPRQSGKTTLIRKEFPDFKYYNLEDPTIRAQIKSDPKAFLHSSAKLAIDEAQKFPELFSFIQVHVDENKRAKIILSGSENFLLSEKIAQSLAGRVSIFKLLPFSLKELKGTKYYAKDTLVHVYKGMYPRVYDQDIDINDWFANYMETYIQRDIRSILNISEIDKFIALITAAATSVGTSLNISSLAQSADVAPNTATAWLNLLKQSYLITTVPAYYENINKTLRKSPKLYFWDTGILAKLLNIHTQNALVEGNHFGNLFENFVITEIMKNDINKNRRTKFYYLKDINNYEVDLVYKDWKISDKTHLLEIKSKETYKKDLTKNIEHFMTGATGMDFEGTLIYRGDTLEWGSTAAVNYTEYLTR